MKIEPQKKSTHTNIRNSIDGGGGGDGSNKQVTKYFINISV